MYTVRPGDTLYSIANGFGASLEAIVQANALYPPVTDPNLIHPGWKLLIRLPGMSEQSAVLHQVTEGDTFFRLAERYSVGLDLLLALNPTETPDILRVAQLLYIPAFVYEAEQGDSLYRISRHFGIPMDRIVRANAGRPGFSPDLIYPGYRLAIPLPSSTNILVYEPLPGGRIEAGQMMGGLARAFEANVLYSIIDDRGELVGRERFVTASEGAPAYGQFRAPLILDRKPSTPGGTLRVYTRSPRDGSIQDLVEVRVDFG